MTSTPVLEVRPLAGHISLLLVSLLLVALSTLMAQSAQADEIWTTPNPWRKTIVPVNDTDNDRMADDYVDLVTDETEWPTLFAKTDVWRSYLNILSPTALQSGCPGSTACTLPPLNATELGQLVAFTNDNNLGVAFETGGLRPSSTAGCANIIPNAGKSQADVEIPLLERWVDAGGRIDYISPDHAIFFTFERLREAGCPVTSMTIDTVIDELGKYFLEIDTKFPGQSIKFGLVESPPAFQVTTPGGVVYASRPIVPGNPSETIIPAIEFATFWSKMKAKMVSLGLVLDHFLTDAGPQVVCADAGVAASACLDGVPDPWDFNRLIEVEQVVQAEGTDHGIMIHPGLEFNTVVYPTIEEGDRGTYDIVMRFTEEYLAAGGVPDIFAPSAWHNYPSEIGPEDKKWSFFTLARDAVELNELIDGRLVVPYLEEDFSDPITFNQLWTTSGTGWSVTGGVLADSDSGTSDPDYESARLNSETFGDLVLEVDLKLDSPSGVFDWAGIHFRKDNASDFAWQSGYTAYIRGNGDVELFKMGGYIAKATMTGLTPTDFLRMRVEAVGSQIRVYVDGERLIDVTDSQFSSGLISLDVFGIGAEFADFEITALPEPTQVFANGFLQSNALNVWDIVSGTWTLDTVDNELDQTATGLAQLARQDHAVRDSFRLTSLVRLNSGHADGWAGFILRRTDETLPPWAGDGYAVYLQESGTDVVVKFYESGSALPTETVIGTSPTSDFALLEVVFVDHRVIVSVNGQELISHFDDSFETGQIGLATYNKDASFDDVILETLSE